MGPGPPQTPSSDAHVVFHYPPELLQLLRDTIPLLCRSKPDVLLFFQGAGVPSSLFADIKQKVQADPKSISKFTIAREILERLNAKKDSHLRELREVVRRVTEFEDFSTCWNTDQLKAKGLVAEVRRVVDVKDAFTRMRIEKETEANKAKVATELKIKAAQERKEKIQAISRDLFALFSEADAHRRGKALEGILNRLFAAYEMLVRESFTIKGACGEGVIEQIDGVVEIDGDLFLVEMKWWNKPLGTNEISPHLVRVYGRGAQAKGIFISYTDYTDAAIDTCRQALAGGALVTLCKLQEVVMILDKFDQGADLRAMLRAKVHAALLDKKPWNEFLG
jgi:restriction system protein